MNFLIECCQEGKETAIHIWKNERHFLFSVIFTLIFMLSLSLILMPSASAQIGYDNPSLPKLESPAVTGGNITNVFNSSITNNITTAGIQSLYNSTSEIYIGYVNTTKNIQELVNNSINSSSFWDSLDSFNSTQMEQSGIFLNIKESWLTSFLAVITRTFIAGDGLTGGGDLSADRTFSVGSGNGISVATDSISVNEAQLSTLVPNNNSINDLDFNGGWESGGVSVRGGDILAQVGYFYNISGLSVSSLNINGSEIPSLNDTFDLGNSTRMWRDGWFARSVRAYAISYFFGGIETTNINASNITTNKINVSEQPVVAGFPMPFTRLFFNTSSTTAGDNVSESMGNWTVPSGVYRIWVEIYGGGGAGGDNNAGGAGGSGGRSGASVKGFMNITPNEQLRISIGRGGSNVASGNGNDGGTTNITNQDSSVLFSASGGFGGSTGGTCISAIGFGYGGIINIESGCGEQRSSVAGGSGGNNELGRGSRGTSTLIVGQGGKCGGGGGGTQTGAAGDGGPGCILIWY